MTVPGYEKRDFRDVEGFDKKTAVIMAVDTPADILKTTDGGKTWKLVYENKTAGMFLDAMEFWNDNIGIVVGDPINGRFFKARSFDGGDTLGLDLPEAGVERLHDQLPFAEESIHHQAESQLAPSAAQGGVRQQQDAAIAGSQQSPEKKREPLRNLAKKVGRNDPCPCGSGKKFKACHMRKQSASDPF